MSPHLRGIGMTSQRTRDRLVQRLLEKGIRHDGVLQAMRQVPRHIFVDEALASRAYEDTALPIGYGQTISQPYMVARMTELALGSSAPAKVLEVGTGCGYQTAILAALAEQVYTVERVAALLDGARQRFRALKLRNIRTARTDGTWGWAEHAPYDAILVTAAPREVPPALLAQLAVGGRLVIPVGQNGAQQLHVVIRDADVFHTEIMEPVSFVPLVGGEP